MVEQIIDITREMVVTIVENTFSTSVAVIQGIIKIYLILVAGASTSPLTTILTIIFLSAFLILIYKFLWASAKTIVIFFFMVVLLFILSVFVL